MIADPRKTGGESSPYLEVGRFGKSHSLHGECRFFPKPGAEKLLAAGLTGFLRSGRGEFIPHRIEKLTLQKSASASRGAMFFLKLDRIQRREDADLLRDQLLWVTKTDEWVTLLEASDGKESFVGFEVYDERGLFGKVISQDETPAHTIVLIEHVSGQEVTVPLIEEFFQIDSSKALKGINLEMFLEDSHED